MDPTDNLGADSPQESTSKGQNRSALLVGDPMHDLYPAMDARFVLVEIGKLTGKVDRLVEDVAKLGGNVDVLRGQVSFVKGAAWIIGALVLVVAPLASLLISGKLTVSLH